MGASCTKAMDTEDQRTILVCGYYGRHNYGDEAFITTLANQWKKERVLFYDLEIVPRDIVERADLIVLGGGDVLQEYFLKYIEDRLIPFKHCPIYAVGVSMPYIGVLEEGRVDCIDAFWCRCQEDYTTLSARYGPSCVFHIPDLALLNPIPSHKSRIKGNRIGLAISMSMIKGPRRDELLVQLRNLIQRLLTMNYEVNWLAFNTDSAEHESDVSLYHELPAVIQRQVALYAETELLPTLVEMDLVIASRFHAHVFSSLANVPVISLVLTRKVDQWNHDHGWNRNAIKLPRRCQWCASVSGPCESCRAYVGWVTSLPVSEICNAVRAVRSVRYNTKRDISLLQGTLARILQMPWAQRGSPPYYVGKQSISQFVRDIAPSWQKFVVGELKAEDLASIICLRITGNPRHSFNYGLTQQLKDKGADFDFNGSVDYMARTYARKEENWSRNLISTPQGLFSLTKTPQHRLVGQHRSGWEYVVDQLSTLHRDSAPLMDTFIDLTFGWDSPFYQALGITPYKQPWMGFIHHPPKAVFSDNDCERMIKNQAWQDSLPHCKALFVLANDLKAWLIEKGVTVPIHVLYHPTDHQVPKFTWEKYQKNSKKRVIQIGAWLRDPYAMFRLHVISIQKTILKCKDMEGYIMTEAPHVLPPVYSQIEHSDLPIVEEGCRDNACRDGCLNPFLASVQEALVEQWRSVEIMDHVSNTDYDQLLVENVVFLPLLKAEAVNTVLDCIVRNTPLIVSRLPAVIDYLGPGYPGYFLKYNEAESKIENPAVLKACHEYLKRMDKTFLTSEYFLTHLTTCLVGNDTIDTRSRCDNNY